MTRRLKRGPTLPEEESEAEFQATPSTPTHPSAAAAAAPLPQRDFEDSDLESSQPILPYDEEASEGENLFGENFEDDYREMPHLDRYSSSQIDDSPDQLALDVAQRRKVDELLAQRDGKASIFGAAADLLLSDAVTGAAEEALAAKLHQKFLLSGPSRQPHGQDSDAFSPLTSQPAVPLSEEALCEADAAGYSLADFVLVQNFRRRVARDFEAFLRAQPSMGQAVREMCMLNGESFQIPYPLLMDYAPFLAKLLVNVPREVLKIFDEAALAFTLSLFDQYSQIRPTIRVRVSEFPMEEQLRELRFLHLNSLVRVAGVVTRRSGVFPQLQLVKFDCARCGEIIGPFYVESAASMQQPSTCPACQSRGPFHVNISQTIYQNLQKMTLQESPGSVPAGRLPRHKEVLLLGNLMDVARPGDEVRVTGIYGNSFSHSLACSLSFPVFSTCIEANHVEVLSNQEHCELTEEDIAEVIALSKNPSISSLIFSSVAPFIHGHEDVKRAIALSLFGAESKNIDSKHRIRGDINVLLLGDPGTGKSQFLKWVVKTAPRAVYTTGQGASAVGLTAAVRKDPVTREWTLEGGALVLGDRGVCLIDEFDKMNDRDRVSIHEAMEQQSISISKAGIVTTLHARCAVIAAANPIRGRYNSSLTLVQNVNLSDPILSRFDLVCTIRDLVDGEADEQLAKFVCKSHSQQPKEPSDMRATCNVLSGEVFKKYLLYAKRYVHPKITDIDMDKVSRMYSELRQASRSSTGSLPITVRHVESIVRIAEARARIHLREWVRGEDLDFGMSTLLQSWLGTQKWAVQKALQRSFSRYLTASGTGAGAWELALWQLGEAMREEERYLALATTRANGAVKIDRVEFQSRLRAVGISQLDEAFYKSAMFVAAGYRLVQEAGGTSFIVGR
jgi:DNA replication licensing factor MCM2